MSDLWERALEELRPRMSQESFETWLAPIQFDGIDAKSVKLRIPNTFFADWIGMHYQAYILSALGNCGAPDALSIAWEVDESIQVIPSPALPTPPPEAPRKPKSISSRQSDLLNPKYEFDSFVVGPANQLAHAASLAVGSSPGTRYNPLFIYGGVGLGKTHLVNAIGHRILQDKPDAQIFYLSAEQFTNEFIWALKNHTINEFRQRYRNDCDVLLMDDIQFLARREQTQEEFFHTFNALVDQNKQIIISADRAPGEIKDLEERIKSRLQCGLVVDLHHGPGLAVQGPGQPGLPPDGGREAHRRRGTRLADRKG